jgi:hypothetical protein
MQALEPLQDQSTSNRTLLDLVAGNPIAEDVHQIWQTRCIERQRWQNELSQPGVVHWNQTIALIESDQRVVELRETTASLSNKNLASPEEYYLKFYGSSDDHLIERGGLGPLILGAAGVLVLGVAGWFFRNAIRRK